MTPERKARAMVRAGKGNAGVLMLRDPVPLHGTQPASQLIARYNSNLTVLLQKRNKVSRSWDEEQKVNALLNQKTVRPFVYQHVSPSKPLNEFRLKLIFQNTYQEPKDKR